MSHHHYSDDPEDHRHHHYNHHHEPPPPPPPPPYGNSNRSCYSSSDYYYYCYPPPPPPQPIPIPIPTPTNSTSDQLLHAIAAHLLQSTSSPPTPTPPPPPPPPIDITAANLYLKPQPFPNPQPYSPNPQKDHQQLLYYSLLRRISALEYSISHLHLTSPKPHFPAPPPPRHRATDQKSFPPPSKPHRPSVQELAARTIQTHFRRLLVRRSQSLRQLKHLAIIKSRAASLKNLVAEHSARRRGDPAAVSEAAMGLLLQLDVIQGKDPMIREGKRAISRELTRILEFVDKVLVKEMEIREDDGNGTKMVNPASLPKRRVRFVGDGPEVNELHVAEDVDEDDDEDDQEEEEEKRFEGLEEAEERKNGGRRGNANVKHGLSARVQVPMESRRRPGQDR